MFDSSSFVNPTPLAHADTSRDVLPRGGTSQTNSPQVTCSPQRVMRLAKTVWKLNRRKLFSVFQSTYVCAQSISCLVTSFLENWLT
ncbi:hypothetical protein TNCV_712241 [Trichonephila clavipes]|nr:hypothetical protein TNCV_712241 [Trichonephila clavipes]